jgi:hypothetical protein
VQLVVVERGLELTGLEPLVALQLQLGVGRVGGVEHGRALDGGAEVAVAAGPGADHAHVTGRERRGRLQPARIELHGLHEHVQCLRQSVVHHHERHTVWLLLVLSLCVCLCVS